MRRSILSAGVCALLVCCFSSVSLSQGSIGVYLDDLHSRADTVVTGPFILLEIYVWTFPGPNGLLCSEFAMEYSEHAIPSYHTFNAELLSETEGDVFTGLRLCFSGCQTEPQWLFQQNIFHTETYSEIKVVAHPSVGIIRFTTCDIEQQFEEAGVSSSVHAYYFPIGTAEASWGAVKSLF
jgi:hypothetical protein